MSGRILVLEGESRMDMIIVVLEWCKDEIMEAQIDEVEKGGDRNLRYRVLDDFLGCLNKGIGNIREMEREVVP